MARALNFFSQAIPVTLAAWVLSSWFGWALKRISGSDYFPVPLIIASIVVVILVSRFLQPLLVLGDDDLFIGKRMVLVLLHCLLLVSTYCVMVFRLEFVSMPISLAITVAIFFLYGWRYGLVTIVFAVVVYPILTIPAARRFRGFRAGENV